MNCDFHALEQSGGLINAGSCCVPAELQLTALPAIRLN